ncbi:MAG: hypothetical protein JW730_18345 [Anaerolineales bacterium]|nr:hypothetical protein [Anaerolineales bacterium]
MATELAVPERLEQTALSWPDRAKAVSIVDQPSYDMAATLLIDIAALEAEIKEHHAPIKEAAFRAHKVAVAAEKRLLDPLASAKGILKLTISAWEIEQERIRRELERQAEEKQRKLAEEAALQAAIEAEQNGASAAEAESILQEQLAAPVPRPVIQPTFQRMSGVSTRQNWHAEVTNLRELARAVGEGRISENYIEPNMTALNSAARAEKGTLRIPGVRAVLDTGISVRGAR